MKSIILFLFVVFCSLNGKSQTSPFIYESDVVSFMNGKSFYNSDIGLEIQFGYISEYNTNGIKVSNKNGAKFYYINCVIDTYSSYADVFGMSPIDGSNFGFRLYKSKLIVGRGEPSEVTFYLK